MPLSKMKTQPWGQCRIFSASFLGPLFSPPSSLKDRNDNYWDPERKETLEDYKTNRENGRAADNPRRPFPHDGADTFETGRGKNKDGEARNSQRLYVTYTEGPDDKKWMEEKDRNYIVRLQKEAPDLLKELVTYDPVAASIYKQLKPEEIFSVVQTNNIQELLIRLKEDETLIDLTDTDGMTLLHHAASLGHLQIVNILLFSGAQADSQTTAGQTPSELALAHKHTGIVACLGKHLAFQQQKETYADSVSTANKLLEDWDPSSKDTESQKSNSKGKQPEGTEPSVPESKETASGESSGTTNKPELTEKPVLTKEELDTYRRQLNAALEISAKTQRSLQEQLEQAAEEKEQLRLEQQTIKEQMDGLEKQEAELKKSLSDATHATAETAEATQTTLEAVQTELLLLQLKQKNNEREQADLDTRMNAAETSVEELESYHRAKRRHQTNLNNFVHSLNGLQFYQAVQQSLENMLISTKAAIGGDVEVAGGRLGTLASLLGGAGGLLPVPLIGELSGGVAAGLGELDKMRQRNKVGRKDKVTLSEMMDLAIVVAEGLTRWYWVPLQRVAALEEEAAYKAEKANQRTGLIGKAKNKKEKLSSAFNKKKNAITLSDGVTPACQQLAACAIDMMRSALESGEDLAGESVEEKLIRAITDAPLHIRDTLYKKAKGRITDWLDKKIRMKDVDDPAQLKKMYALYFFLKAGVQSPEGMLYAHAVKHIELGMDYGYGTAPSRQAALASVTTRGLEHRGINRRPDYQAAQREAKELSQKLTAVQLELQQTREEQRERMAEARQKQEEESQKHDERINELEEALKMPDLKKKVDRLVKVTVSSVEQEFDKAKKEAEEANREVAKLKRQVATLESEKTDLNTKNSHLESRVESLESTVTEMQTQMRQLLAAKRQTASVTNAPSQILFSDPGSRETSTPVSHTGTVSKSEMQREDSTPNP